MADLIATGLSWLNGQRESHLVCEVTYKRGNSSVALTATKGKTELEKTDTNGVLTRIETRDFLISASLLLLNALHVQPQKGDRIEETVSDTTFKYEVLPAGSNDCWQWSDPNYLTYRIHTKLIGAE